MMLSAGRMGGRQLKVRERQASSPTEGKSALGLREGGMGTVRQHESSGMHSDAWRFNNHKKNIIIIENHPQNGGAVALKRKRVWSFGNSY